MANSFASGTLTEFFIPDVQDYLDTSMVSKGVSEVYEGSERVIHNKYNSNPEGSDGTATVSYSITDFSSTDDTLSVNRRAVAAEHIDSIEELQTNYSLRQERAQRHAYVVMNQIDKYMLNLPVSFSGVDDIDDGDFSGTAGNPYQITNSNADNVANTIVEGFGFDNAMVDMGMSWIVPPNIKTKIVEYLQSTGNVVADDAIVKGNGFTGQKLSDLRIVQSNNLTHEVTLNLATNPTDGDTITLKVTGDRGRETVTITFVDTLSGSAGEVHIGTAVDDTRATLAQYLNDNGANDEAEAATAGYSALADAKSRALKAAQISATNDDSADTLALTLKGSVSVSETLTDGTDAWGNVGVHTIATVNEAMFLALPSDGMEVDYKGVTGKHGRELETSQVYNGTIWEQGQPQVKDVYLYV